MNDIDYEQLDPGIRDIVGSLRAAGFETTDSGDGVSKPGAGDADERGIVEVMGVAHVAAAVTVPMMISEADRLHRLLGDAWRVEASYCPNDGSAILFAYLEDDLR